MKTMKVTNTFELPSSDWRSDKELARWEQKLSEVSTRLTEAENRQRDIGSEIDLTEPALIQAKSSLILGEGSSEDVTTYERTLESLRVEQNGLSTELEALQLAQSRIQQEITQAEGEAKRRALDSFRPFVEEKSKALLLALDSAQQLNEDLKALEGQLTSQQLCQQHGWLQQTIAIENIQFPSGILEFQKHVEARIRQLFKE